MARDEFRPIENHLGAGQHSGASAPHGAFPGRTLLIGPTAFARLIPAIQREGGAVRQLPNEAPALRQPDNDPPVSSQPDAKGDTDSRGVPDVGAGDLEVLGGIRGGSAFFCVVFVRVLTGGGSLVRLGLGSDRIRGLKSNLIGRRSGGSRRSNRGWRSAGMEQPRPVFAVGRFTLVIENFLKGRTRRGAPRERPAAQRNEINKFTAGECNHGGIGKRSARADKFAAHPGNHLGSFAHGSAFPTSHPNSVSCDPLSQRTRTDSVARVIPV